MILGRRIDVHSDPRRDQFDWNRIRNRSPLGDDSQQAARWNHGYFSDLHGLDEPDGVRFSVYSRDSRNHRGNRFDPALLAIAITARYGFRLAGTWRLMYVVTASMALYLNVFVLVVQAFEKAPALHALAPTQSEPPFVGTQLVVLVVFIILTLFAGRKFHPASTSAA